MDYAIGLISDFSQRFSALYDVNINVTFPTNCPATINDSELTEKFVHFMKNTGKETEVIVQDKSSLGADDFAFYAREVPGLYILVGGAGKGNLHSGNLELNEALIEHAFYVLTDFLSFLQK